jgi:phosphoribosylaminoimidazole-succinocarboxamide synthase
MPEEIRKYKNQLEDRAMLVKKAEVVPIEAIVRGYLAGTQPISIRFDVLF